MLAALLVVGLFVSLIEVSIFGYIGSIVDLLKTTTPASALGLRADVPVDGLRRRRRPSGVVILHDLLVQQSLAPSFTNLVVGRRIATCSARSVGFFDDDFAGRIASKIMQTGPALRESVVQVCDALWFVTIYSVSALILFGEIDLVLTVPLAGLDGRLRRDAGLFRAAHPRALDHRLGSALDAHRPHRRQLHQYPDGEALRPYHARGRLRPRRA